MNRAPIKVCHAVYRLDYGGMENGLVNLINRLGDEFEHTVLCMAGYSEFAERITVPVRLVDLNKRPGQDFRIFARAFQFLRRHPQDVMHTRNLSTLEMQLVAAAARVPLRIHGEHGLDMHDLGNTRARYRWMRRLIAPCVHRFVPLSLELERYLSDAVGISDRKLVRICNGVDVERFRPDPARRAAIRSCLPASIRDATLVGYVGRFQEVKNPLALVEAFVSLAAGDRFERGRLGLVMVGDGPLLQAAETRLAEAGLSQYAWLPGRRDDVPAVLSALDVFVLPSLAEGISNSVLEALASGLPVVAAEVGGNAELVTSGETGVLVREPNGPALADALAALLSDESVRAAAATAARESAFRNFDIARMVDRYGRLYAGDRLHHGGTSHARAA